MEVSEKILDFLTGINGDRSNIENRKNQIFDRAFELAYKDMTTHTVAYTKETKQKYVSDNSKWCNNNKTEIKNGIKKYVKENIFNKRWWELLKNNDSQENCQECFNKWHEEACKNICTDISNTEIKLKDKNNDTVEMVKISILLCNTDSGIKETFTYGQAQKLINMMVKYLYIYYQCEGLNDLENIEKYAHVPIDRYVLKEVFGTETYNNTPWSKIDSYQTYQECKKQIDKKAENASPFIWELTNWPFNDKT